MVSAAPHLSSASQRAVQDRAALLTVVLFSFALLWFGGAAAGHAALLGTVGSVRTHATLGGLEAHSPPASYGEVFEHVVTPLRTDLAASITALRIEARDLLPLRWGWGYA